MFQKDLDRDLDKRANELERLKNQLIDKASIKKENYYFLADMIKSDENAIGFLSFVYAKKKDGIMAININKKLPTEENISHDTYPLKRPLYIYTTNKRINQNNNAICNFINYYLTTVNNYVNDVGYFAIEEPKKQSSKQALNNFLKNRCPQQSQQIPNSNDNRQIHKGHR